MTGPSSFVTLHRYAMPSNFVGSDDPAAFDGETPPSSSSVTGDVSSPSPQVATTARKASRRKSMPRAGNPRRSAD